VVAVAAGCRCSVTQAVVSVDLRSQRMEWVRVFVSRLEFA